MHSNAGKMRRGKASAAAGNSNERPVILAVGEVSHWRMRGRDLPVDNQITYVEFHDVTTELIETLVPDVVLSPLLCPSFDCLDLAQLLEETGFRGRYRAMTPGLPNPGLIRGEIRTSCPGLDFDLLYVAGENDTKLN